MKKYFTADQLEKRYHKLSKVSKIAILWEAIGIMEKWVGAPSRMDCVFMAMGFVYDSFTGSWYKYRPQVRIMEVNKDGSLLSKKDSFGNVRGIYTLPKKNRRKK